MVAQSCLARHRDARYRMLPRHLSPRWRSLHLGAFSMTPQHVAACPVSAGRFDASRSHFGAACGKPCGEKREQGIFRAVCLWADVPLAVAGCWHPVTTQQFRRVSWRVSFRQPSFLALSPVSRLAHGHPSRKRSSSSIPHRSRPTRFRPSIADPRAAGRGGIPARSRALAPAVGAGA